MDSDADDAIETVRRLLEWVSLSIEVLAVVVIVVAIVLALSRTGDVRITVARSDLFTDYKRRMGRGLLLSLELMLAADIVSTVALTPTLESLAVLGLLALIRTFLSWSLDVEIDGCWPWRIRDDGPATDSAAAASPVTNESARP